MSITKAFTLAFRQLICPALVISCSVVADATTLSVIGPTGTSSFLVSVGQNFQVDVSVNSVSDLYAWQFDLGWNSGILSLTSLGEGAALTAGGATFFVPGVIDNVGGSALANADTLVGAISGVTGLNEVFESFDFSAISEGSTSISLNNVILLDSSLDDIAETDISGTAKVIGNAVPPIAPAPEPTSFVLVGAILGLAGAGVSVWCRFKPVKIVLRANTP